MACLDTTILIDLCRRPREPRHRAEGKLRELVQRGESVCTTRFNVAELMVGVFRSDDPEAEAEVVTQVLSGLSVLEFGAEAAEVFGKLTAHLHRLGRPAGDMDVLIAATTLCAGETTVVTRNPDHFTDLPGCRVEMY